MTLRWEHRFDEAIAHARSVLRTHPNSPSAWNALHATLWFLGRYEDALDAQRQALGARGDPALRDALEQGYAEGGPMGAGEHELALDRLELARDTGMPYISVAPVYDSLRAHPRFQALLERMGLPPYYQSARRQGRRDGR